VKSTQPTRSEIRKRLEFPYRFPNTTLLLSSEAAIARYDELLASRPAVEEVRLLEPTVAAQVQEEFAF